MTTFIQRNKKAFKTKILVEELPTLNKLMVRRPDLYDNWNCVTCDNAEEDLNHLWTCLANQATILNLNTSLWNFLEQTILSKLGKNPVRLALFLSLKSQLRNCVDLQAHSDSFYLLTKGLIPSELFHLLRSLFAPVNTSSIIGLTSNHLIQLFHDMIWLSRCTKLIDKERSVGITSRQKRLKKKRKKKSITTAYTTHTSFTRLPPQKLNKNSVIWKSWLTSAIKFGNSWLDFVNRY